MIERSRDTYRQNHPKAKSKLANGLLRGGAAREVIAEGLDHPEFVETYRMSEAALALGRSMLTLKRWIKEKIIPEPILKDVIYGYKHYRQGELKLIAK